RWFALVRLLLVEALLFQTQLAPISSPLLGTLQSLILVVFGIFTLVIIFGVAVRRVWPTSLAYATATIDLAVAVILTAGWQENLRSEERRVGKECRSRGSAYH